MLAKTEYGLRERRPGELTHATFVPFTRADPDERGRPRRPIGTEPARQIRKGAAGAVMTWVRDKAARSPAETGEIVDGICCGRRHAAGRRRDAAKASPASSASSTSRTSSSRACASGSTSCARMGIRTVMITGDNPLTAKAIADEAGVDDFLAEATPEDKMALIQQRAGGRQARRDDR